MILFTFNFISYLYKYILEPTNILTVDQSFVQAGEEGDELSPKRSSAK